MGASTSSLKPLPDKNAAVARREAAEARLKARPRPHQPLIDLELQKLQHELEVHAIELEMQNEELLTVRAELEAAVDRNTDFFDAAPVGFVNLTAQGKILQINLTGAKIIGIERAQLVGQCLQTLIDESDRPAFATCLRQLFGSGTRQGCEVRLHENAGQRRFISLEAALSATGKECRLVMHDITERKLAEESLRRHEFLLQEGLQLVKAGYWEWNLATNRHIWSPETYLIYGRDPALGPADVLEVSQYFTAESWARLNAAVEQAVKHGTAYECDAEIIRGDGSHRWVTARGKAFHDSQGGQVGLRGTLQDITERKQAELQLRVQEEMQKETSRIAKVGGWTLDAITGTGFWTEEMARIHDTDPLRPISKETGLQYYVGESRSKIEAALEDAIQQAAPYDLELEILSAKGVHKWVRTIGHPVIENGGVVRLHGSVQDITERKQIEAALRESEATFRAMFEVASIGMAQADPKSRRWVRVNQKMCDITGFTAAEMLRMAVPEVTHPEDREKDLEQFLQVVRGEQPDYRLEKRYVRKDGETIWVNVNMTLIRDAAGRPIRTMATIEDITERKQAEANQAQLAAIVESSMDGIFSQDPGGIITSWNRGAEKLYDYTAKEIVGTPIQRLIPEERKAEENDIHERISRGENVMHFDTVRRCKDGRLLDVSVTASPIRNAKDQIIGVSKIIRDITERKRSQQALTNERMLLRNLVDNLPVAVYLKDTAGRKTLANPVDLRNMGLTSEAESLGKTDYDLFPPEQAAAFQADDQQVVQTGQPVLNREEQLTRADGSIRCLLTSKVPIFDNSGAVRGLAGLGLDITERKRAEAQIHVQIAALSAAANAIVITNRDGKIEWVNPAFTKLTGYSAEEAIGGNPRLLRSGEHPTVFYGTLWATILTGNVWHGEWVNKRKDGRLYTEEMTITPVQGADGQIAHFVAVKQDITERRQMEKRMLQSQKMEAIGQLAGGIAHDFNNMLAALFGYAHLLQQDTVGNPLAQESIAEILTAANRAKDLVQQILSFSRQREQKPQVMKLDTVIKEVIKFLRASPPAHIKIGLYSRICG